MLDVAIIGGGVCGLALAHSLQARRVDWQLFEARARLGGRVLSVTAQRGTPLDLGPAWFWPGHQPSITRLVADLGLTAFAQTDDGRVLHLVDPARPPETVTIGADAQIASGGPAGDPASSDAPGPVHGGAQRIAGGMARLVEALARPLPPERLQRGAVLHSLSFEEGAAGGGEATEGPCVTLSWVQDGAEHQLRARRVVLALPPRVAEATLQFEPPLSAALVDALRATPTWMATAAKAAMAFEHAVWRQAGHSGNAWVTHPQAVLSEVFDAGTPGQGEALAGFLALGVQARQQFQRSLDLLTRNQLGQLFGPAAEDGDLHLQDWALEPTTCSPLDAAEDGQVGEHPAYGHPLLAQAHWGGRLLFGGSETARQGGGYLEGALSAAARLRRSLLETTVVNPATASAASTAQARS